MLLQQQDRGRGKLLLRQPIGCRSSAAAAAAVREGVREREREGMPLLLQQRE